MPKPASTRPAYKMLTCIYLCRTLLFFAPYADFCIKKQTRLMKYKQLISGAFLLWTCIACSGKKEQAATVAEATSNPWDNYYIGKIDFKNLSPEAKGSAIYAAVILIRKLILPSTPARS